MDIAQKKIWQVAAGDGNRHYAKDCLQNDVIIVGPGGRGSWPECEGDLLMHGRTKRKMGMLRRFFQDVQPGDLIILRVGTQTVYGVGQVVGPYMWVDAFADVQGWDLQHTRRVRWLWQDADHPKMFPVYSLKLGSSLQNMDSPEVLAWLNVLEIPQEAYSRPLSPLPKRGVSL